LALSVGVSALVGVWMMVLLLIHVVRQRKHDNKPAEQDITEVSDHRLTLMPLSTQLTQIEMDNDVRFDAELASMRIDANDIMQIRTIAHGSFAVTYLVHFGDKMAVMKQLIIRRDATDHDRLIAFMDEIRVCAKLDHKNITAFYGLMWAGLDDLSSVVEYMPRGSLDTILREQRPILKSSKSSFLWFETSSATPPKLSLAIQVSEALVYLHSFAPAIFHCNLKAENVLLGSDWEAKLMGLGYRIAVHTADALPWAAPEVLRGGEFTAKADVFSFGVLLSELDRCKKPVSRRSSRSISVESMSAAVITKPKFRDDCPADLLQIAMDCLDDDPDKRPNAMELHFSLRQLQRRA
jgi:serine/threonine protein kinase